MIICNKTRFLIRESSRHIVAHRQQYSDEQMTKKVLKIM